MKVSELTGAQLDYWVARAEGHLFISSCLDGHDEIRTDTAGQHFLGYLATDETYRHLYQEEQMYSPSTDWSQGGQIIEKENISIVGIVDWTQHPPKIQDWSATMFEIEPVAQRATGKTQLIAAMRAFVASKFGEDVPDE